MASKIDCTGQKPSSQVIESLVPTAISPSGHIKVKETLQIDAAHVPNVYACGDVADTHTPNPNARSAMRQATVVAENVLLVTQGKEPKHKYTNLWADGVIKLTLGLVRGPQKSQTPRVHGYSRNTGSLGHTSWGWKVGTLVSRKRN